MEIFSFRGRVPRMTNFITQFLINLSFSAFDKINETGNAFLQIFVGLLTLPMLWISFATLAKRSYDIGRSGWFPGAPIAVLIAYVILFSILGVADGLGDSILFGGVILISMYLLVVLLIVTFKAGDKEPNIYGLVPLPFRGPPTT